MHDVIILGAGVVGCSIARELARYNLDILVLEREADVAAGQSKANSGIVHAGHDAKPGTLKARYNVLGQGMFDQLSKELDFPFRRCGSLVVAFASGEMENLERLKSQGEQNGVKSLSIINQKALRKLEPNISDMAYAALNAPTGGIVCPYEMTIAFAENAAENGVKFQFECIDETFRVEKRGEAFFVRTRGGELAAKYIINAAGICSDQINNMLSRRKVEIRPRRGEYCLLDKTEGDMVSHTIFRLPTEKGKGILVSPTVDGNILLGPTSEDMEDKADRSTTQEGLRFLLDMAGLYLKRLDRSKVITSFAGLRAHGTDDFIVGEAEDVPGFINACGIESPGLTSAPAIAKEVERIVVSLARPEKREGFTPYRKAAPRFRHMSNDERKKLIAENPDYGKIICRCETVTKGEILAALRSPLSVQSIDAVKRRTRTGMGRCQAGFCNMRMVDLIAEELGISLMDATKCGGKSNLLIAENKSSI